VTRWTHESVRKLSGDRDPVEAITESARSLVVRALDAGWQGPPFDPLALADILGIEVFPTADVRDARTVPIAKGRVRIEFNPNRPRGRLRYSLAHEIAHTLFPDCNERVRNRASHSELKGDEWQLEALCNIAASELLMPVGTFAHLEGRVPNVEALLEERKRFDVSTEALFIRAARVSDEPIATFCSSRVSSGPAAGRYRLDYLVGSRTWTGKRLASRSELLPASTVLADCSAIGFTSRADESWDGIVAPGTVHVECVGIPPYPGTSAPRVVGMIWDTGFSPVDAAVHPISIVRGDATRPRGEGPKIIVQVVNDATANWGGNGFASAIRTAFPEIQRDFKDWWASQPSRTRRLGETRIVRQSDDVWVASLIAQHGYGASSAPRIRYSALRTGLERVAAFATEERASLHMPRIGCGQAGGRWIVVEELLRDTVVAAGAPVTVYDPPDAAPAGTRPEESLDLFL